MKRVLVTGAGGYIGKHVVAQLKQMGAHVIGIDRNPIDNSVADQTLSFDIFDASASIIEQIDCIPDACLHLAWRDGFNHNAPSHMEDLSAHFAFLMRLVDAGVQQIAVMGSMHEVGYWEGAITEDTPCNPQSLYGVAKNALREALSIALKDSPVVLQWLRGFYIVGDDAHSQSIFGKLLRAAEEGQPTFPFTTGKNEFDFISLDELAFQIAAVVMQDEVSGIINCCSGTPMSLADRVEAFIADHGLTISLDYGAFPDRPYDSPGIWGDRSKIDLILGNMR